MTRVSLGCPADGELHGFHARELPDDRAAQVAAHLASCDACAERSAALLALHDAWVGRIRSLGTQRRNSRAAHEACRLDENAVMGYRVLEQVGRGGQGVVYRAFQLSTRREVALKLLPSSMGAGPVDQRRFDREIELAASLQHPNVVHVLDSGALPDGRRFVVMDYVTGVPLSEYVRRQRPALEDALRLFAELCDGVNHAHQRGVIHRDVKPSNVLVDAQGRPRVLDFGLARAVDRGEQTSLTLSGQIGGTLAYMSPEQARGLRGAGDVRSDVYSLGVMLYELLAGQLPYSTDGDVLAALRKIAEAQPLAPSRALRGCPVGAHVWPASHLNDELDTIVLCALAKEPERRYQTAGALADELRRYLGGQPIAAKRDSVWYVMRKSFQRHRPAAFLALGLILTVSASAVTLGWMYADQRRLRHQAESAARQAADQALVARQAEADAKRRFDELRALGRFFIFELDPLIRRLPGAADARQRIVTTGLRYIDALAAEAAAEPDLQLDLAGAYRTLGDVQGDIQSASFDKLDAALESYAKARDVLDSLAAQRADDVRIPRERVLVTNKIAQAHAVAGRQEESRAALETAINLAETALARYPGDRTLRDGLADAHDGIAHTYMRLDPARAERHYLETMRLAEQRAAEDPGDLWLQRDVGVGHSKLAQLLVARNDPEGALAHYRSFLESAERLLGAYPQDMIARRDVLTGHQWIGILLAGMGRTDEALDALQRSVAAGEALQHDPMENSDFALAVATTCIKLGETQLGAGRLEEARGSFEKAVELIEPRADRLADRASAQRLLGVAQYKLLEYYRTCARDESRPALERGELWTTAAAWAQCCLDTFVRMRELNMLDPSDAAVPQELATELETCRTEAERFTQPARDPDPK